MSNVVSTIRQIITDALRPPKVTTTSFEKIPSAAKDPWVDAAVRDLRTCFVAYKRHKEEDSLQTIWDYWELMGSERYENGEAVFRRYIWSRLTYVDKHGPKWLGARIRRHFREIGFNLYNDGFRDFPQANPADSSSVAESSAGGRHDEQDVDDRGAEEAREEEDTTASNSGLFQEEEPRGAPPHASGGPG